VGQEKRVNRKSREKASRLAGGGGRSSVWNMKGEMWDIGGGTLRRKRPSKDEMVAFLGKKKRSTTVDGC